MRILYIDHHAALPSSGGDCRAVQLAQAWRQVGDEVTVVTAGGGSQGEKTPAAQQDMWEQQAEGVRLCRLAVPERSRGVGEHRKSVRSFLKKLYIHAPELASRYQPEIVIAASGYPYDFFCAQRVARLSRGKVVFELREPWAEQQREQYPGEENRLNNCIAEYAMGYALRGADAVVSFLQKAEDYCREKGRTPSLLVTLAAPVPPQAAPKPLKEGDEAALAALRKKSPVIAAYAGRLNDRRLPELLAGAAGSLQGEGVAAVIAGNGGYKQLLRRAVRENGWENVLLLDGMSERRQRTLYAAADILYYGDDRRCDARYGSYAPLLLQMMQSGKPVLTATHSAVNAAAQAGCAVAAEPTQQGVREALRRFAAMEAGERAALGRQAEDALRTTHAVQRVAMDYRSALLRLWV